MRVDRSQDRAQRERLQRLVNRLTDEQLARPLQDGWTVAASLAHLAFWDRRAAWLVERWRREGRGPATEEQIGDVDVINEAAKPAWLGMRPRAAAEEVVGAAHAADAALDAADARLLEQIEAAVGSINVSRAAHRAEHIDEIEQALGLS